MKRKRSTLSETVRRLFRPFESIRNRPNSHLPRLSQPSHSLWLEMVHQVDAFECVSLRRKASDESLYQETNCQSKLSFYHLRCRPHPLTDVVFDRFWEGAELIETKRATSGKPEIALPATAGEGMVVQ